MKTGLVTDSTSDVPADLIAQHQIEVVPALLVIDGESYADGEGITREEFYTRMPTMKTPATTSAPSAGSFMQRYEKLLNAGAEKVISIHADSWSRHTYNTVNNVSRTRSWVIVVCLSQ